MQSLGYGTFASKLCLWILWWTCHGLTKGIKKIIQTGKWRWFCLCQCRPGSWKARWIAVKSHCSKIFFIRLWGILWPIVEMWKLKLLNPFNITERPYPGNALWADTDGTLLFSCLHWLRIEPLRNNHCLSFPPALPSVLVSAGVFCCCHCKHTGSSALPVLLNMNQCSFWGIWRVDTISLYPTW